MNDFFGTYPPTKIAGKIPDYVKAVQQSNSSITSFGLIGVRLASSLPMLSDWLTNLA